MSGYHGEDVLRDVSAALGTKNIVADLKATVLAGATRASQMTATEWDQWIQDLDAFMAAARTGRYSRQDHAEVLAAAHKVSPVLMARRPGIDERVAVLLDAAAALSGTGNLTTGRVLTIRTPGGALSVIRPVAEQLLSQGVVSGSLDGELHAADAAVVKAALATTGVCDFCSAPGPQHVFDVPDFNVPVTNALSTGDWAACDECADLVRKGKKKQLLDRAMERMAFSKWTRPAIAELQARFWRGIEQKSEAILLSGAVSDFVEGTGVVPPGTFPVQRIGRDGRLAAAAEMLGLPEQKMRRLLAGHDLDRETVDALLRWRKQYASDDDARRAVGALLGGGAHKPLPDVRPHWQVALDMKFNALALVSQAMPGGSGNGFYTPESVDLSDPDAVARVVKAAQAARDEDFETFAQDAKALRHAEVYSFNAETAHAISIAALSIPHETPLAAIETPGNGRAGWFWFAEPLPIKTCDESDVVNAILWYWEPDAAKRPQLTFSVYVLRKNTGNLVTTGGLEIPGSEKIVLLPSTTWNWHLAETFREMMEQRSAVYKAHQARMQAVASWSKRPLFGEEATLAIVGELTMFFVAACLWVKERVAVSEPQHVERHERKRLVKQHKLSEPPSVRVIALRRSEKRPAEPGESTTEVTTPTGRKLTVRSVVSGHPRLQPCGPGRKDRKLIWINPFIRGPEGAPLVEHKKVYAVVR